MWLVEIFDIDQDIIQIYLNKDIKLLNKDLVDVALKTGKCVEKAKKHHLLLKMAVFGIKSCLSFVTFSNSYPIIGTSEIQLGKPLGPA